MDNILFLCIGNSNIIGDSLGPLIGSFLQSHKKNICNNAKIDVLGTLSDPIGYKNITNSFENKILRKEYSKIVVIDSALGTEKNIGKILINNSKLCAGNGVNIGKNLYGDVSIKGIVGKNHNNIELNILELNNISPKIIDILANKILTQITQMLKAEV